MADVLEMLLEPVFDALVELAAVWALRGIRRIASGT